jgi:hypothetical protein
MGRHGNGSKSTATKPERQHAKAVDAEIRNPTPENKARSDRTFDHLHKTSERFNSRHG